MLDAELDIALVVDTAGVGELVGLEPHQGGGLAGAVLELSHDLLVHRAALGVDETLVTPAQPVPDGAAGDVHPVDVLVVDADHQSQGVADLDVLGHQTLGWLSVEDPHAGGRHGCCGCERSRPQGAAMREVEVRELMSLLELCAGAGSFVRQQVVVIINSFSQDTNVLSSVSWIIPYSLPY